jgi:sulfite reductase alpha subunit-like flavoprotein
MTTWLSKEIPQLKNIHFAVFGLGSSNYTEFGKFPKKINSFFKGLGMTELIELVIAD